MIKPTPPFLKATVQDNIRHYSRTHTLIILRVVRVNYTIQSLWPCCQWRIHHEIVANCLYNSGFLVKCWLVDGPFVSCLSVSWLTDKLIGIYVCVVVSVLVVYTPYIHVKKYTMVTIC